MTKEEEAIEILKGMIKSYIEADECGLSNNDFKHEIRAMQTVLSMLKEKDKEIEKKDRQINFMANFINDNTPYTKDTKELENEEGIRTVDFTVKYFERKVKHEN